jgi:hypothetical protein
MREARARPQAPRSSAAAPSISTCHPLQPVSLARGREDKLMAQQFPNEYAEYKKRTKAENKNPFFVANAHPFEP